MNIIYTELRRRGFNVDVGIVEKRNNLDNGKKDYKQLEIDFVANKGSDKYYIESFIKWQDDNGIIYISIYDFLLSENSLKEA